LSEGNSPGEYVWGNMPGGMSYSPYNSLRHVVSKVEEVDHDPVKADLLSSALCDEVNNVVKVYNDVIATLLDGSVPTVIVDRRTPGMMTIAAA